MNVKTLNKIDDGKYWTIDQVSEDGECGVRLRIIHATLSEVSDVQAELGLRCGSAEGFEWLPVGTPFEVPFGVLDCEDLDGWTEELPELHRKEFTELAWALCQIAQHLDLAPTSGLSGVGSGPMRFDRKES